MANSEPLNIRLSGTAYEPTGRRWASATIAERIDYWRHFGEFALDVKRQEIRKGIGADGRKLKPVKPRSRPDGAKGPPLIPHYAESRTARLLALHVMANGVTLFWRGHGRKSWAKILGYHAYQHGPRALPVRNTIGISDRGTRKIVANARDWWTRTHPETGKANSPIGEKPAPRPAAKTATAPRPTPKPPARPVVPSPAPRPVAAPGQPPRPPGAKPGPGGGFIVGRVHYLAPGQKPNPLSKYIQVASSGRAPKPPVPPKPTPKPKPAPPPPKPAPLPKPPPARPKPKPPVVVPAAPKPLPPITPKLASFTPKPVTLPPAVPPPPPKPAPPATPIDSAVAYAQGLGIKIERNGYIEIARANGPEAVDIPAVYRSSTKTIYLNEQHSYWQDPAQMMDQAARERWFSAGALDHVIVHEAGHALHNRAVGDTVYQKIRQIRFTPAQTTVVKYEVSKYAASKPVEFVAETYAGLKAGKTYSPVVMSLYAKLGGPKP